MTGLQLEKALIDLIGAEAVRSGEAVAVMDPGWHKDNLAAGLVVMPASTGDVARLLAWCNANNVAVVPHGGRTGLVGGGVSRPGQVVLSMQKMASIERLDAAGGIAVVGAGVTLARLQAAAAAVALDPGIDTAARDSATIGGMISTNAGGMRAFRHGVMRHRVLGLEAVLADGTILSDLSEVMKNTTGYDVKQLFIGAEGTLGVVTRAALRLEPLPGPRATALIGLPDMVSGVQVVDHFRRLETASLHAAEVMSGGFAVGSALAHGMAPQSLHLGAPVSLIIEVSAATAQAAQDALVAGLASIGETIAISDGIVADTLRQRDAIWLIRESSEAMARRLGYALWEDISVPPARIDAWLDGVRRRLTEIDASLRLEFIGHLADGNLHVLVARDDPFDEPPTSDIEAALYDGLASVGGAFAAEHGIGTDKIPALNRFADEGKRRLIASVKATLDPKGILNPGKVAILAP
jgi:FAD/FMN-containing dehydrogenase